MIRTPTTFVIGAGASKPYGYPTGIELRNQARNIGPNHPVYKLIHHAGIGDVRQLNRFLEDLRQHPTSSIDAFLEHRQDDAATMRVGRAMIAGLMGTTAANLRSGRQSSPGGNDWLGFVIEQMRAGAPKWRDFANGNNRVRFVTFNFDDVIEARLGSAVKAIYRGDISESDIPVILGNFPVLHVHGKLPPLPEGDPVPNQADTFTRSWLEWIVQAADSVRVVLDEIDAPTLELARKAVATADVLCFLGFAYANENLKGRLQLPECITRLRRQRARIFGSATGEAEGARSRVLEIFSKDAGYFYFTLGTAAQDCGEFLRAHYILRG